MVAAEPPTPPRIESVYTHTMGANTELRFRLQFGFNGGLNVTNVTFSFVANNTRVPRVTITLPYQTRRQDFPIRITRFRPLEIYRVTAQASSGAGTSNPSNGLKYQIPCESSQNEFIYKTIHPRTVTVKKWSFESEKSSLFSSLAWIFAVLAVSSRHRLRSDVMSHQVGQSACLFACSMHVLSCLYLPLCGAYVTSRLY